MVPGLDGFLQLRPRDLLPLRHMEGLLQSAFFERFIEWAGGHISERFLRFDSLVDDMSVIAILEILIREKPVAVQSPISTP